MRALLPATLLCCLTLLASDKPKSKVVYVTGSLVSKEILGDRTILELKDAKTDTAYHCMIGEVDRRFALYNLGDTFTVNGVTKGSSVVLHRCDIVSWKQSSPPK
jgi:hypothetical protein